MAEILLVDDNSVEVLVMRASLEKGSHNVRVAGDGEDALQQIADQVPDIVVTDLLMPRMNGLELVKHLRKTHPQLPVVLITAFGTEDLSAEALRIGAAAYLPKPDALHELPETIDHVLELLKTDYSYKDLINRLDYHELQFTLENDLNLIGPLVNLLQQLAAGVHVFDDVTRTRVGMALEHAIHNGMVRGNLELDRDQLTHGDDNPQLMEQRRHEAPYGNRRVQVRAHLGKQHVEFMIRDEGKGFDISKLPAPNELRSSFDPTGGRGLVLIQSFMDVVRFNDVGNEITMIKKATPLVLA